MEALTSEATGKDREEGTSLQRGCRDTRESDPLLPGTQPVGLSLFFPAPRLTLSSPLSLPLWLLGQALQGPPLHPSGTTATCQDETSRVRDGGLLGRAGPFRTAGACVWPLAVHLRS